MLLSVTPICMRSLYMQQMMCTVCIVLNSSAGHRCSLTDSTSSLWTLQNHCCCKRVSWSLFCLVLLSKSQRRAICRAFASGSCMENSWPSSLLSLQVLSGFCTLLDSVTVVLVGVITWGVSLCSVGLENREWVSLLCSGVDIIVLGELPASSGAQ